MTKIEFIHALQAKLTSLPQHEIEKSVSYYSEIIDDRVEDGMTEEEAVSSLEDINAIADKILYETPLPVLMKERMKQKSSSGTKVFNILFLILGFPLWFPLLIAFFSVLFAIYITIWSLIIAIFAVVLSFAVAGLFCLLSSPFIFFSGDSQALLAVGAGFLLIALAIFAFFPALAASKGLIRLTALVARKTKSLFIQKENQV